MHTHTNTHIHMHTQIILLKALATGQSDPKVEKMPRIVLWSLLTL